MTEVVEEVRRVGDEIDDLVVDDRLSEDETERNFGDFGDFGVFDLAASFADLACFGSFV